MSASLTVSKASYKAVRASLIRADADEDIKDFLSGQYALFPEKPWEVDSEWLEGYEAAATFEERKKHLEGATSLARWMARWYTDWRGYDASGDRLPAPSLRQVLAKAIATRRVARWMRANESLCAEIGAWEHRPFPESLVMLGVDGAKSAQRFADFYRTVQDPGRVWLSHCQVSQSRTAAIALTPNYNRLPDWCRQGLMSAPDSAKIGGDRIGNVWRLLPCVKAWKWAPLPKKVAEKVGKQSPRFRMLSAIAWASSQKYKHDLVFEENPNIFGRHSGLIIQEQEKLSVFWSILHWLQNQPIVVQCEIGLERMETQWGRSQWSAFLSESLGLPFGVIELPKQVTIEAIGEAIAQYASPRVACLSLFGVAGKATERVFRGANQDAWRWAAAIAYGDHNAVQKVLGMQTIIAFEPDAVDFLKSLPMVTRLRLLQETTFRYRGEECNISSDHIRDAGYLWANIETKPDLGRLRCWFSIHEALASAFVEELPDEAVSIPMGWEILDGLCSVNGAWELEFPRRVATLKYWGKVMRNCIGGYGPAVKSGRSVVFAVREQGQLTHCVEFDADGCCRQFYQSGNQPADHSIQESVLAAIGESGFGHA